MTAKTDFSSQKTTGDIRIARMIQRNRVDMDHRFPEWARRSNPIIRRQLGVAWKTILPEFGFLRRAVLFQIVLVILSLFWPFIFDLALPAITASILMFPFALIMYGNVLLSIGVGASDAMTRELRNDTLTLLRVTPFNLENILASKIAAAIWRQVEDLGLLLSAAALLSMPLLVSQYATWWPLKEHPVLARVAIILGLTTSLFRLVLEPFMIGAVGMAMGVALRQRASAIMSMLTVGLFYFLILNLLRLVPMEWPLRFVVEFALPLVMPLVVIGISLRLAHWLLNRG
jgi:hypothetical protein